MYITSTAYDLPSAGFITASCNSVAQAPETPGNTSMNIISHNTNITAHPTKFTLHPLKVTDVLMTYIVVSRYYDTAGIRNKYHNSQTIEIQ